MTTSPLHAALAERIENNVPLVREGAEAWLEGLVARFIPTTPNARVRLAAQVADYLLQKRAVGEDAEIDEAFISRVLSIHTGLARVLVDPGPPPSPDQIARELRQHGAPDAAAEGMAAALVALISEPIPDGPRLAIDLVGPDVTGRRASVRALAAWALGSPLRVIRANTARQPLLSPSAARTLALRPLQVVRLADAQPTPLALAALRTGALPSGGNLRGALLIRTSEEPIGPAPGVHRVQLPGRASPLHLLPTPTSALPLASAPPTQEEGALVLLEPIDGPPIARDHLAALYRRWAEAQGGAVEVLHEPMTKREAGLLRVTGPDALARLGRESGLHRVGSGDHVSVARVRVGTARAPIGPVAIRDVTALKAEGLWSGRIRSRVCTERGLVLQNRETIRDNRHRAIQLEGAWLRIPKGPDVVVRRVQLSPFHVFDERANVRTSDPHALDPEPFDALLRGVAPDEPDGGGAA